MFSLIHGPFLQIFYFMCLTWRSHSGGGKLKGEMLNAEKFQADSGVKRIEKQGDMKGLTKMKCA